MNPAIIKTKKAHGYVGGRKIFEDLLEAFPKELVQFRKTPRGDASWRVETIDHVIRLAEASRTLIPDESSKP